MTKGEDQLFFMTKKNWPIILPAIIKRGSPSAATTATCAGLPVASETFHVCNNARATGSPSYLVGLPHLTPHRVRVLAGSSFTHFHHDIIAQGREHPTKWQQVPAKGSPRISAILHGILAAAALLS
jgi:hypothetical protein